MQTMPDARWQKMWELFEELRPRPVGERTALLDRSCGDDPELRQELEELLEEHDAPSMQLIVDAVDPSLRRLELAPGDRVGPYRIVAELGQGGMGVVYRAEQLEPVQRAVALKLIRPGMDTREIVARFEAERRTLAALEHDRIARVFDAGVTDEGRPYFVMELVDSKPITKFCAEHGLSLEARLALFHEVCEGVQHAHRRGVIHRDLKPSNILVREIEGKPVAKIIDFGIARATEPEEGEAFTVVGRLMGTPEYMSPEQASLTGDGVDTRTDVYALGVVLYELLTGANPYDAHGLRQADNARIQQVIREVEPPRPSARVAALRGDLDWIVMRAMEKDRERRYGSPAELAADLERVRDDLPVEARPPSWSYRARKYARRHRVLVGAGALVVAALIAGVAVGTVGLLRARDAEREARREAATSREVSDFLVDLFQVSEPGEAAANSLTAREVLDRGVENVRGSLEGQPEVRGRLLQTLGGVYTRLGLYDEARPLLDDALELHRAIDGEDGLATAASLGVIAGLELETGNYERALELYRRVLAINERELGAGHPNTMLALENIGSTLESMQRAGEAVPYLERAVAAREAFHGPEDPETAKALFRLSAAQTAAGQLEASEVSITRALGIFEAVHEPDHPWIQYALNALAVLYWQQERLDEARPALERATASIERTHGADHPYTAQLLNNLGYLILETGDPEGARGYVERALAIQQEKLAPNHPTLAATVLNAARIHAETGNPEEADRLYARGIRIREVAFGENHGTLAGSLRARARVLRELGRDAEASALEERAELIEG